jgi:hypothetical protein
MILVSIFRLGQHYVFSVTMVAIKALRDSMNRVAEETRLGMHSFTTRLGHENRDPVVHRRVPAAAAGESSTLAPTTTTARHRVRRLFVRASSSHGAGRAAGRTHPSIGSLGMRAMG